jgi:hypothetical protein
MKKLIKISPMFLILAFLAGCEKIKDLTNVEFDTDMSTDLNINVADASSKSSLLSYSFSDASTLDPLEDSEVKKYKEKIEDYDVNSLTATVISVSKPEVALLEGTYFQVFDSKDTATWTLDAPFYVVSDAVYTLDNTNGNWDKVRKILKRNSVFTVAAAGESSTDNVTIVFEVSIGATVTANPL